jgi:hypothetical protein
MHNRKAKRNIPELNVELNSLLKRRDILKNGNMMKTPKIPRSQKICPVCNYGIGKGYHICKSRPSSSTNGKPMVGRGYARSTCQSSITWLSISLVISSIWYSSSEMIVELNDEEIWFGSSFCKGGSKVISFFCISWWWCGYCHFCRSDEKFSWTLRMYFMSLWQKTPKQTCCHHILSYAGSSFSYRNDTDWTGVLPVKKLSARNY